MQIVVTIVTDFFIAAIALFAVSEFYALRRFNSFTVPYTDKMISLGIIRAEMRETVLRQDRINYIAGTAISLLACALMARFLAWPSGAVVCALTIAGACIFTRPEMNESDANRESYFRLHKASMDSERYGEMLRSAADAAPREK